MNRKVGFNIEPTVHIYKKRKPYVQEQQYLTAQQEQHLTAQQEQYLAAQQEQYLTAQQEQQYLTAQQEQQQEPKQQEQTLKIDIPKEYEEIWEEPPAYDKSPISPRTHQEIRFLRAQEQHSRVKALTNAIKNFTNNASPESIMSMTSPSLSPLCLS